MSNDTRIVLGLDTSGFVPAAKQAEKALDGIGTAGQTSARQIAAATRTLPAQFTDIATQLQGGASPFTVLLQQGGQIKDSFGGVGNAIKGIAATITPASVIIGGLAATFGSVAYGAIQGAKEAANFRNTIVLTGNAAGLTADRLTSLGTRIADSSQQTVGSAREIVSALAATGTTAAKVVESQALAAARIADLTGKAGAEIAASFAGQLEAPAKFAAKLNETYNFLSVADFKRIQALERGKKVTEAANLTNDLLVKSLESQRSQLGYAEQAWDSITKAISRAKEALLAIGRPDTTKNAIDAQFARIQELQKRLAETPDNALKRGPTGVVNARKQIEEQLALSNRRIFELMKQADKEQTNAQTQSDNALANRQGIDKLLNAKPADPLSAIRNARQQYKADFLRSEKDAYDDIKKAEDDQLKEDEQRTLKRSDFLQGLVDANQRASAELIADERDRGLALIELDREIGERRIRDAELTGAALAEALALNNEAAALSQVKLDKQITDGLKAAADAASQSMTESISTGILEGFRRGGSLADIFLRELKAQFAKTVLQPLIRPAVDAGNAGLNKFLSGIAGLLAPDLGLNPAAADFATGETIRGRRAGGGDVQPYSNYLVGERGPEVLRMGAQGGSVIPNHALGGTNVAPNISIHIDGRADQGQVAQLVSAGVQQGMRATMEQLRIMGVVRA